MRNIIAFCFFIILSLNGISQDVNTLEKELDSLKSIRDRYQLKVENIKIEISNLEKQIDQIKLDKTVGEVYYSVAGTNLTKTPDKYEVVVHLPSNRKVKLLSSNATHYKINFNDSIGWVLKSALISEKDKFKKVNELKAQISRDSINRINQIKISEKQSAERKVNLIKKYGQRTAERILDGELWIGMTAEMAKESWGTPDKINRSVGSWGVHEQWIYERQDTYVYFENGVLTSWQD